MPDWLRQLERLGTIEVDASAELPSLLRALQERQSLLDRVQNADISQLPERLREPARQQLLSLLEGTRTAERALQARQRSLLERQQRLVTGRLTARGYRPDVPANKRSLKRNA